MRRGEKKTAKSGRKAYRKRVPTKRFHLKEDSSDERPSKESSEESLFKCLVNFLSTKSVGTDQ